MACDPALRAHVEQCRQCSDYVVVAQALGQARLMAFKHAALASPGQLWWKAELRRRNRDFQRVSTPVNLAGAIAMSISVLAALGLAFWQRSQIAAWTLQLSDVRGWDGFGLDRWWPLAAASWTSLLLLVSIGMLALFGTLVLYLATQRE